jgi:choice-of-anchor B domain-containing protein
LLKAPFYGFKALLYCPDMTKSNQSFMVSRVNVVRKVRFILGATSLMMAGLFSGQVFAHAEHDKPRFISSTGVDEGECDLAQKPCLSFRYTVEHANKGDKILVDAGRYDINDADSLFVLLSELIPVKAGFSKVDGFKARNSQTNITHLTGVPAQFAEQLRSKGFTVNPDQKALNSKDAAILKHKLSQFASLSASQSNVPCIDGRSGLNNCDNVDLLAHVPLSQLHSSPVNAANDIWGFVDLNDQREYAIIGLNNGISVVDVTNPTEPTVVGSLSSQNTTWRDVKTYQYYDETEHRFKAYAYVTADSANVGLMVVDLSALPNSISLANVNRTDTSAHNVYLSNVDYTTSVALTGQTAYLHIAGANNGAGAFKTYSLNDAMEPGVIYTPTNRRYTHDVSSMVINDDRTQTQCTPQNGHCEIFFDFNANEFMLWDKTNNIKPKLLSETTYDNATYIHSGWWSEDKMVALVHDELDEQAYDLNTTLRLFDISDMTAPKLLSIWKGPTRAIDHNGFVRGSRYYMSNYERGLTILDISNPSAPKQVGFFDTYPLSDNDQFNGAWGVYPYLPSGNILISDINSGLYILADNTVGQANQDSAKLSAAVYDSEEGQTVAINVSRIGDAAKAVSVHFETNVGSADVDDFTMTNGTLSWAAGDSADKVINLSIGSDTLDQEVTESLFIRLYDPRNGLALAAPNIAMVNIKGIVLPSYGEFASASLEVKETDGTATITVNRGGDFNSPLSVNFDISDESTATLNDDYEFAAGTLSWGKNDSTSKTIELLLVNDDSAENLENIVLKLNQNGVVSGSQQVTITIRDDDSNQPADVNVTDDFQTTGSKATTLSATAVDPEGYPLSYLWSQVSGTSVNLQNRTASSVSFVTPSVSAVLVFELSVSDDFAALTSKRITVTVDVDPIPDPTPDPTPDPIPDTSTTPPPAAPGPTSGGGGSLGFVALFAGLLLTRRRLTHNSLHGR